MRVPWKQPMPLSPEELYQLTKPRDPGRQPVKQAPRGPTKRWGA